VADLRNDHRICFIGDSMTQGTSDPACQGWVGRVSAAAWRSGYAVTAHNLGIRGDTSRDIALRWQAESALRLQADCQKYLVFSFGANDMTPEGQGLRVPVAQSLDNFQRIVSAAQALHPTRVIGPFPVGEVEQDARIQSLCTQYAQCAMAIGVPYLPVAAGLIGSALWRADVAASDGCHPGAAGYQLVADLLCAWPAWWFATSSQFQKNSL
jgi:acyl-CoA thioesterase-1